MKEAAVKAADLFAATISLEIILDKLNSSNQTRLEFPLKRDDYYAMVRAIRHNMPDELRERALAKLKERRIDDPSEDRIWEEIRFYSDKEAVAAFAKHFPSRLSKAIADIESAGLDYRIHDNARIVGENSDGYPQYELTDRWSFIVTAREGE